MTPPVTLEQLETEALCGAIWQGRVGNEPVRVRVIQLPERHRLAIAAIEEAMHLSAIRLRRLANNPIVAPLRGVSRDGDRLLVVYGDLHPIQATTTNLPPARVQEVIGRLLDVLDTMHDSGVFLGAITPKDVRIAYNGSRIEGVAIDGIGIAAAYLDLGLTDAMNRIWTSYLPTNASRGSSVLGDLESLARLGNMLLGEARDPEALKLRNHIDRAMRGEFGSAIEFRTALYDGKPPRGSGGGVSQDGPTASVKRRAIEANIPTQQLSAIQPNMVHRPSAPVLDFDDDEMSNLVASALDDSAEVRRQPLPQTAPTNPPSREIEVGAPTAKIEAFPAEIDVFEVRKKLGQGAFATVFQVRHRHMDRLCALKLFSPPPGATPDDLARMKARFVREATLAGRLTGEFHVPVHDFRYYNDLPFLVMDYVEGETLHDYLKNYGALSERQAARFAVPILRGLSEAHYRGIVHRDIKPSNLMVSRDYRGRNTMRILDFGIAIEEKRQAHAPSPTRVGEFVGSPQYAAPEQFVGDATSQSDIYSLGVTLYEIVTRKRLCTERAFDACFQAHTSLLPWEIETESPGFGDILRRALAKPRDERYLTAEAMLEDVQLWLRDPQVRFLMVEPV